MIIYSGLFSRGFCFKPFIIIPKSKKDDNAYLAHEMTHYNRQGLFPILWVRRYFADKEFRWNEEKKAFEAEIMSKKKENKYIDYKWYKKVFLEQYWGMCTTEQADDFISEMSFKDPS